MKHRPFWVVYWFTTIYLLVAVTWILLILWKDK
jgi:hypothetical protein